MYRLFFFPRSIVARARAHARDAFVLAFRSTKKKKKKKRTIAVRIWHVCVTRDSDRIGGTEGLFFEERRRETGGEERYDYTVRRGEERRRKSRTLGGSSQSSGWVSTRPVIIGAYLHEHTSNVPNQTSSHVARVGRHCSRVYKARLFLFPPFWLKKREKNHAIPYFDVRSGENVSLLVRSKDLLARRAYTPGLHDCDLPETQTRSCTLLKLNCAKIIQNVFTSIYIVISQ